MLGNLTYTYGAGGNRTQVGGTLARTALPAALASATYDSANQLTQWGAANLTHDANGNNPVNWTDGTGLWSTLPGRNQHASLIEHALKGAPKKYIEILTQCGGFKFDTDTQGPEDSYLHSMRDGVNDQSPANAIAQRNKFVSEALAAARSQALKGGKDNCEAAVCTLGQALHPIIDSTSPFHVDPRGKPRPSFGKKSAQSAQHVLAEARTTLTPEVYAINDDLIRHGIRGSIRAAQLRRSQKIVLRREDRVGEASA